MTILQNLSSAQELLLRISAVLKRTKTGRAAGAHSHVAYNIGSYSFDYLDRALSLNGSRVRVSTKEAELLRLFSEAPNELINRQLILKTVWGDDDYFTSKSMDVYMTRIRKLLKEDPAVELQNVHGIGYKMVVR